VISLADDESNDPFIKLDLITQAYSDMIYILSYYHPELNDNNKNKNKNKIFH
jgi:hypothetical protein